MALFAGGSEATYTGEYIDLALGTRKMPQEIDMYLAKTSSEPGIVTQ